MTREDKQLLLKDLCGRLPYNVKVLVQSHKGIFNGTLVTVTTKLSHTLGEAWIEETDEALWCDYSLFKPYLRPMSSMTEKELKWYYNKLTAIEESRIRRQKHIEELNDWLNAHHFDYRGLIEKGLALEAPEGMYKTE